MISLRVRFLPCSADDVKHYNYVTCIGCGKFRCDYIIDSGGMEPYAGVHKACVEQVHMKRGTP